MIQTPLMLQILLYTYLCTILFEKSDKQPQIAFLNMFCCTLLTLLYNELNSLQNKSKKHKEDL